MNHALGGDGVNFLNIFFHKYLFTSGLRYFLRCVLRSISMNVTVMLNS